MIREQLTYGLGRLAAVARQRDWGAGEAAGLTPTQGDVLRLLADRPAGLRLKDLAAQLSVRPSTASDVVSALVGKGLAERSADPDNGKAICVTLSPGGRSMLGQVPDGHHSIVELMSDDDVAAVHGAVLRTITRLQRAGQIAPQRMCVTCRYFVSEADLDASAGHFCRLIKKPLEMADLRINCPEHEELTVYK
ncbi:MAG: MarR family transcriptional regulator [Sphingorhabdus sp.]|uniref:MarR family winged helix-turn-helix transcriptional regulator n=1 Tax=Sphingorhabdus sp. TaxID=1902408 RepID=UPI003C7EF5D9